MSLNELNARQTCLNIFDEIAVEGKRESDESGQTGHLRESLGAAHVLPSLRWMDVSSQFCIGIPSFRLAPLHVFVYILACYTAMLADRGLSQGPIFDLLH